MARAATIPRLTIARTFAVDLVALYLIGFCFALWSGAWLSAGCCVLGALVAHASDCRRVALFHHRQTSNLE